MKFLRILILIVTLIALPQFLNAQIKTNLSLLTPQEQQYLNTTKTLYKEYQKLYRQYRKDSTQHSKKVYRNAENKSQQEINHQIRSLTDSLYHVYGLEDYEPIVESYERYIKGPEDWKDLYNSNEGIIKQHLGEFDEEGKLKEVKSGIDEYSEELDFVKTFSSNPDSVVSGKRIDEIANDQMMQLDEVKELKDHSANIPDIPEWEEFSPSAENAENQIRSLGTEFLNENHNVLQDATNQFSKLKKKYTTVPSSKDISTATKANGLKDLNFTKRLILGGNLQLTRKTDQTHLDLAPLLGYKLNKRVSIGLSGVYRATFGRQEEFLDYIMAETVYGGRIFFEYQLFRGFFSHGEYERMNNKVEDPNTDNFNRIWVDGVLLGLGKQYRISKTLKGNVMLLYNTLHEEGLSPYKSPWQLRFGVGKF